MSVPEEQSKYLPWIDWVVGEKADPGNLDDLISDEQVGALRTISGILTVQFINNPRYRTLLSSLLDVDGKDYGNEVWRSASEKFHDEVFIAASENHNIKFLEEDADGYETWSALIKAIVALTTEERVS